MKGIAIAEVDEVIYDLCIIECNKTSFGNDQDHYYFSILFHH